uniref:Protein RFT1 homolog n=1 Tax=Aureoumbra lagunensis TaxID=44058 RepID=A0A7S3NR02_9STRA|mmetsp:Transcript_16861/g.25379  ORF Transcript_16861/g.25379 Transcript_16861/m.25379 type:complete len:430 (+) Transcript_16861:28-1317(+)
MVYFRHWLWSTAAATGCWSLSDICCDCCIEQNSDENQTSLKKATKQLTPEQNAVLSAMVSGIAAIFLVLYGLTPTLTDAGGRRDAIIALVAGAVHFAAYAIELKAYRTASSTVITPLLQLSAVWMTILRVVQPLAASALPHSGEAVARHGSKLGLNVPPPHASKTFFSHRKLSNQVTDADLEGLYMATSAMRPAHVIAVFFIFVGGFLPAAHGNIKKFADRAFYRQDAVRFCVIGELLVCIYNALLHMCTFRAGNKMENTSSSLDITTSLRRASFDSNLATFFSRQIFESTVESTSQDIEQQADVLRFFVLSRVGTLLSCILVVLTRCSEGFGPSHFRSLIKCDLKYLLIALLGEILSVSGVLIVMFSYASFSEAAVCNAAEGGMQQLLNLILALAIRNCVGMGRQVDDFRTKVVSFALVSAGLALSVI